MLCIFQAQGILGTSFHMSFLSLISFDVLILSITTFFAVIDPIGVGVVFGAISGNLSSKQRMAVAIRSTLIATTVLLLFSFFGQTILTSFGISISALKISGGILLFLVSIKMIFVETSNATSTTQDEFEEAKHKDDISVFPLAIPLIAGPAAMGAAILLMSQYEAKISSEIAVIAGLIVVLICCLFFMLATSQMQKFLGVTGINVIQRIFGVLLSALAIQFILDGIVQSNIFIK